MNSRDAAYDYSALFPAPQSQHPNSTSADEEMKLDDESPPPNNSTRQPGRSRRGQRVVEDDEDETPTNGTRGTKRRRGSNDTSDPNEPSTKVARKSGKRGVGSGGNISTNDSDNGKPGDESSSEQPGGGRLGSMTPLLEPTTATAPVSGPPSGPRKRGGYGGKRGRGGQIAGGAKMMMMMERMGSEEPGAPMTPTTLRRFADEMMKPARARIPQARSGLNEMRKRVGAILEFVGRLQADANGSPTPTNNDGNGRSPARTSSLPFRGGLIGVADEFVEGGEYEKPDLDNAPSVIIMQYLTKRCLEFEVKFGKYPGRYP
jgi:hypothetical protein